MTVRLNGKRHVLKAARRPYPHEPVGVFNRNAISNYKQNYETPEVVNP